MIKPKTIVVSAVNLTEGGGLTVLKESLASAAKLTASNWRVIALVHNKKLVRQPEVELIEMPSSKRSWLTHLYYEWFVLNKLSKKIKPDLWLSLHDVTPLVNAKRQAVYCHNPAPFYSMTWREFTFSPKFWIFTFVYKYLYRLFIKRNTYVIVQQEWLRRAFTKMFGELPLVVAYPNQVLRSSHAVKLEEIFNKIFLYPVIPRFFKNFEVICEAAKILEGRNVTNFEVRLTLDGSENSYSNWICEEYKTVKNINFIGLQTTDDLVKQYQASAAVIFPSKLETWGLPISEAKSYKKALILADLPYAHEAVGNYDKVSFFPPTDANALADLMQAIIEDKWQPICSRHDEPKQPFVRNWDELWDLLIRGL